MKTFISAYITAALWCGVYNPDKEDTADPNDYDLAVSDLSPDTLRVMRQDAERFYRGFSHLFVGLEEAAGHDLWLTRNGHGSGFWDSPEVYGDEIADELTVLAKNFRSEGVRGTSEFSLYLGDDGLVYHCAG